MANAQSTAMPDPDLDSDDAEDKAVQAQVNSEIAEQVSEDESDGEAVELAAPNKDDSSIKSIENKDGKIYKTTNLSNYARAVNEAVWTPNMRKNTAMSVKMQALLDWNHASPGPIDGGWGMNSTKALANFQTMRGLPSTGKMDTATWNELTKKSIQNSRYWCNTP
nr:peptidoglycan-binding domain-containing protein [Psychrobacter sp. PraFG1]UNK06200.1 peptidoglycan-binding protein [Psychrobacter sp. PraFG1]